jgi:hypothetical protein
MITGALNTDINGRFAKWQEGTRVTVTPGPGGVAFIERLEPSRGPGRMTPLLDQMCDVPMDCLDLDGAGQDLTQSHEATKAETL